MADDWVWDSWVADDGERYHRFFLKAPRPRHRSCTGTTGTWVLLGFRNFEPDASALEIVDPIPVALGDGELIELR